MEIDKENQIEIVTTRNGFVLKTYEPDDEVVGKLHERIHVIEKEEKKFDDEQLVTGKNLEKLFDALKEILGYCWDSYSVYNLKISVNGIGRKKELTKENVTEEDLDEDTLRRLLVLGGWSGTEHKEIPGKKSYYEEVKVKYKIVKEEVNNG